MIAITKKRDKIIFTTPTSCLCQNNQLLSGACYYYIGVAYIFQYSSNLSGIIWMGESMRFEKIRELREDNDYTQSRIAGLLNI